MMTEKKVSPVSMHASQQKWTKHHLKSNEDLIYELEELEIP